MTPTEALLASPDAGLSLWGPALRIAGMLILMIGAAAAWIYWQKRVRGPVRHLEVIDRTVLTRGSSIALIRVDDRKLLLGVSADGVRLLRDMDSEGTGTSFTHALEEAARVEARG